VEFERPGKKHVVVPARAAHAVQEVIDLVDQCFQERAGRDLDVRQERTKRWRIRNSETGRKTSDGLFAVRATILKNARLVLDFASETEHAIGVAFKKTFLLLLEEAEKFAVFSEFLPETFSDALPVHIMGVLPDRRMS
jgi:hypothetical protein